MDDPVSDRARLLHEAAEELGWSNPKGIAELALRLQVGLPAEDELSVIFNWLGRCQLVHKLDQFPYPRGSLARFRVPDLLAAFDVNGRTVPVLIEVKTSEDNVLSWRPDFLAGLKAYSAMVNLPLLVAWRFRGIWLLFEARHMKKAQKNYNIAWTAAMRETLLSALAGDFSFSFHKGVGLHFIIRKLKETDSGFEGLIEEAYFLNARGDKHSGEDGVFQLFACSDHDVEGDETATHAHQRFVVQADNHMEFAHRSLLILLGTFGAEPGPPAWRQIQRLDGFKVLKGPPLEAAESAMKAGFVRTIVHIHPNTPPSFMELKAKAE